jgi:CRISPR-associated protein Cas1
MSWKVLNLETKSELRMQNFQLSITQADETVCVPLDNLCAVIFATNQIKLTSAVLASLSNENVVLITTNEKYLPNGALLGFHQHSRQSEVTALQASMKLPLKKQLWKQIVQQKILNQSIALGEFDTHKSLKIKSLVPKVKSGDSDNTEAIAAKIYWTGIFFPGFVRHSSDLVNMALNYTYAIVRAMISRSIAASGLIPALGVHHCNMLNAFNLSDDLIEPFRPIVDLFVRRKVHNLNPAAEELSKELRKELLSIGFAKCEINGKGYEIATAIQEVCDSFVRSLRTNNPKLLQVPSHSFES